MVMNRKIAEMQMRAAMGAKWAAAGVQVAATMAQAAAEAERIRRGR